MVKFLVFSSQRRAIVASKMSDREHMGLPLDMLQNPLSFPSIPHRRSKAGGTPSRSNFFTQRQPSSFKSTNLQTRYSNFLREKGMSSVQNLGSAKAVLSSMATLAASAMLLRSIVNDFLPDGVRNYFNSTLHGISRRLSSEITIIVEEFRGFSRNEVFAAVDVYLGKVAAPSFRRVKVGKDEKEKALAVAVDVDEEVIDTFEKVAFRWRLVSMEAKSMASNFRGAPQLGDLNVALRSEVRSYELSFHKKHKDKVFESYLPYIMKKSGAIQDEIKAVKLYSTDYHGWNTENVVTLDHPMTFRTLAMDPELKKVILEDLDNFLSGEEYYRSIGRAWKRGYLLYGPPGTGKSSLIAAIANHLNFDIYDLDLTEVRTNVDLKYLMLSMSKRSILVIEDIDCSINLENRETDSESHDRDGSKVTLSGLLNFMDGLLSCCGEARIIILTTNHREKLDPALLRPGRMDMHICLSYCTGPTFKELALNYLGLRSHPLFDDIERLIAEAEVTPAEVAGELMKSRNTETSLQGLVTFLRDKIAQRHAA